MATLNKKKKSNKPVAKNSKKSLLELEIENASNLKDVERLQKYRDIANDLANQFSYDMSFLETAIKEALDEVSRESKEETGYWNICDITQDINVKRSDKW